MNQQAIIIVIVVIIVVTVIFLFTYNSNPVEEHFSKLQDWLLMQPFDKYQAAPIWGYWNYHRNGNANYGLVPTISRIIDKDMYTYKCAEASPYSRSPVQQEYNQEQEMSEQEHAQAPMIPESAMRNIIPSHVMDNMMPESLVNMLPHNIKVKQEGFNPNVSYSYDKMNEHFSGSVNYDDLAGDNDSINQNDQVFDIGPVTDTETENQPRRQKQRLIYEMPASDEANKIIKIRRKMSMLNYVIAAIVIIILVILVLNIKQNN